MRFAPERRDAVPRAGRAGFAGFWAASARPNSACGWAFGWLVAISLGLPWPVLGIAQTPRPAASNPPRMGLLDAVMVTLEKDPVIQVQKKQVLIADGAAESAAGPFDTTLDSAVSSGVTRTPLTQSQRIQDGLPIDFTVLQQDTTTYQMGLTKQLRSGVTVGSGVAISRVQDNGNQQIAANVGQVVFYINVPLLRGFGRSAVTASERAAHLNADAAALDLRQTTAMRVLNTVAAYWNCWAAERQMEVFWESADRSRRLLGDLSALVRANEFPSADLDQASADQEEKQADLLASQQQFYDARQTLGLAMGLGSADIPGTALPEQAFLPAAGAFQRGDFVNESWIQRSLERRSDYQSALKAEQASAALLVAARNNVKPRLDLNLQIGYTGLDSGGQFQRFPGSLDPWTTPGPNLLGTLRFDLPFGNHAARGVLAQRDAARDQAAIRSRDLARNITSALEGSATELEAEIHELQRLDQAVARCQKAVDNETEKLKLGHSTVIDQITIADRCANTLVKRILARARYATALVRVRYESGLIVPADRPLPLSITSADLLTSPTADGSAPPNP